MAILKNKKRQPQVFNLDAPFFVNNQNETPFGKSCSLSFLALERKEVPDAVLSCAEIKSAIADGRLRLIQGAVPAKKAEAAPEPVATLADDEDEG